MITDVRDALLRYANLAERCEEGREKDAYERGQMMAKIGALDTKVEAIASQLLSHIEREEEEFSAMRRHHRRREDSASTEFEQTASGTNVKVPIPYWQEEQRKKRRDRILLRMLLGFGLPFATFVGHWLGPLIEHWLSR